MKANEKVTSMDRSFCVYRDCEYKTCDRHQCHVMDGWAYPISIANFRGSVECMENEEMLPCPFCGGEAEIFQWYIKGTANRMHYNVRCRDCGCVRKHKEYKTRRKAIMAWNRRRKNAKEEL